MVANSPNIGLPWGSYLCSSELPLSTRNFWAETFEHVPPRAPSSEKHMPYSSRKWSMNVASPESNGLPIRWWEVASRKRTRGNYTLEQLLSPFGLAHIDATLAALGERGLKKAQGTPRFSKGAPRNPKGRHLPRGKSNRQHG